MSQYRLAAHLALAVLILGCLFWVALDVGTESTARWSSRAKLALVLCGLVFLQIVIGGFVAGLDAGQAYNSWPLMDGELIPEGLWARQPWYLNLFENAVTVQFLHRMAAYVVAACVLVYAVSLLSKESERRARISAFALVTALLLQFGLGIATLLAKAPLSLSLAHQAGAMLLFLSALYHAHVMRAA